MSLAQSEADRSSPDRRSFTEASPGSENGGGRPSGRPLTRSKHSRSFRQVYSGLSTSCEVSGVVPALWPDTGCVQGMQE